MWEDEDAHVWLLEKLSSDSYEKLCAIVMTLWGIWFFRNKVWENKIVTPKFVMEWSVKQLADWKRTNDKLITPRTLGLSSRQRVSVKWVVHGNWLLKNKCRCFSTTWYVIL